MTRRPALTVIEALMAIFVMAIGLLALLTLFPLGAVSMAQALKDQRTAEASINATSQFKAFGIGGDGTSVVLASGGATIFESPWPAPAVAPSVTPLTGGSTYSGPSYAVYVDPIYALAAPAGITTSVGVAIPVGTPWTTMGGAAIGIPRTTVTAGSVLPLGRTAQQWFTLQDDLTYGDNGLAIPTLPGPGGIIQREGRYSWAYMLRRSSAGDTGPLDLTVVVYSGRSPGTTASGAPLGETVYGDPNSPLTTGAPSGVVRWGVTAAGGPDADVVTIDWTTAPAMTKPALRRGSWILDARMTDTTVTPAAPAPQGYFYRVVSVTDVAANVMEIEVQRPLGGQLRAPNGPGAAGPATGPLIVVENVSEVFEKGTIY